jgi:hypothetical protein
MEVGSVGRYGNENEQWDHWGEMEVEIEMGSGISGKMLQGKWEAGSLKIYGGSENGKRDQWGDMEEEMGSGEVWKRKWEMRSVGRYGSENEKRDQWEDMEVGIGCGKWGQWGAMKWN